MTKFKTPSLDIDKEMKKLYGHELKLENKVERRVIGNLLNHIVTSGFTIDSVYDGEESHTVKDNNIKSTMEVIFNLDESRIYIKNGEKHFHNILITLGNGDAEDIISDWSYSENDSDGFNACMEKFNPSDYE